MRKLLIVLAILSVLIISCVPVEKQQPADEQLQEVIEKVDELVDVIMEKDTVEEVVEDVEETVEEELEEVEAPVEDVVEEVLEPVFRLDMDWDPTTADEFVTARKGIARTSIDGGKVKGAWRFDGNADYVVTTSNHLKELDDFTVLFWMKPADLKKRNHMLWQGFEDFGMRGENAANGWGPEQEIHVSLGDELGFGKYAAGILVFYLGDEENNIKITKEIKNLDWQHIAVVVENVDSRASAELFLDGHSVGKKLVEAGIARDQWGTLKFGKAGKNGPQGDSDRDYDGQMDEFTIYDKVLSADEIAKLCRRQNNGKICNGVK